MHSDQTSNGNKKKLCEDGRAIIWNDMHGRPLLHYRCNSHNYGFQCPQKSVKARVVERQVIDALHSIHLPPEWRERILQSVGQFISNQQLEQRMAEIRGIIDQMDFRFDNGFISNQEEYQKQRIRLQQELDDLTPIPTNQLEQAADMLDNFANHWESTNGDRTLQRDLIQSIVERVYVDGKRVVGLVLRSDYFVALG